MRAALLVGLTLAVLGCRRAEGGRKAPESARPGPSASSSAAESLEAEPRQPDPEAARFPAQAGELALDAHTDPVSFGGTDQPPVSAACSLLATDCAKLERLGLRKVLRVSYVGVPASPMRVVVTLLRFESAESAYAHFTGRIGEAAEAGKPVFSALALPGAAVLGDTTLLLWKAEQFLEFAFSNERLPPGESSARATEHLPPLARAIGARLPGEESLPPAARLLPVAGQEPLSIRYDRFDLAELPGLGPGARARYHRGGDYEFGVMVRSDADAAEDVLETLRKLPGARVLKNAPYRATRLVALDEKSGRRVAWLFGQKNTVVAGVGAELEPRAIPSRYVPERDPNLRRLKKLLDGIAR